MIPVAFCGLGLSGCSVTIPLAGLGADDLPTGTIKEPVKTSLSAEMDPEDWRRARSALDTALDPQGNGAKVAWDNPQTGSKGYFVPVEQPFPKDDGICRGFAAEIDLKDEAIRAIRSSACRKNGGAWIVGIIKPLNRATASAPRAGTPHKSDNLAERDTNTHLN